MKYKIIITITIILVFIQFIKIEISVPLIEIEKDYLLYSNAPVEIANMLKNSCYDCHSYETEFPWYSNIAPASWLVKNHIKEARKHFNFSEWENYPLGVKNNIQLNCIEEIKKGGMPLKSYSLMHSKARLSKDEKTNLINWFNSQQNEY